MVLNTKSLSFDSTLKKGFRPFNFSISVPPRDLDVLTVKFPVQMGSLCFGQYFTVWGEHKSVSRGLDNKYSLLQTYLHCRYFKRHTLHSAFLCKVYNASISLHFYTLHTAHGSLYPANGTHYTVHCTHYTVHCTLHTLHCTHIARLYVAGHK